MEAIKKEFKLEQLAREYKQYARIEEEAKTQKELLAAEIKAHLGDYGTTYAGDYKLTFATLTQSRVDSAKLKKEYPAIAELVTVATSYDRLTIN